MSTFIHEKEGLLKRLAAGCDNSPKGNIDAPILPLVEIINANSSFVTTSTCSGRISVFVSATTPPINLSGSEGGGDNGGKGGAGRWALSSHAHLQKGDIAKSLVGIQEGEDAILKHEPAILHIRCINMDRASWLLKVALGAGFRESGIVPGKTKVMVAIRTTATLLELPLVQNGTIIASDSYLDALETIANERFSINDMRLRKLERVIREAMEEYEVQTGGNLDLPGAGGWVSKHTSSLPLQWNEKPTNQRRARRKEKRKEELGGSVYRGKKSLRRNERKLKDAVSLSELTSHVWAASCALPEITRPNEDWTVLMFGGYGQESEENKKTLERNIKVGRRSDCFWKLEGVLNEKAMNMNAVNIPPKKGKGGKIRNNADPTAREHTTLLAIPALTTPALTTEEVAMKSIPIKESSKKSKSSHFSEMVLSGNGVLLFGGRASPKCPLNDLWLWNGNSWCELVPSPVSVPDSCDKYGITGEWPCARWGHTFTALNQSQFVLIGGRDGEGSIFDDTKGRGFIYTLTLIYHDKKVEGHWHRVELDSSSKITTGRFFHTSTLTSRKITTDALPSIEYGLSLYGGWKESQDISPCAELLQMTMTGTNQEIVLESITPTSLTMSSQDQSSIPMRRGGHCTLPVTEPSDFMFTSKYLVVLGGSGDGYDCDQDAIKYASFVIPILKMNEVGVEVESLEWCDGSTWPMRGDAFIHGSALQLPSTSTNTQLQLRCLLIGGGLPCFAFGPLFTEPCCLNMKFDLNDGQHQVREEEIVCLKDEVKVRKQTKEHPKANGKVKTNILSSNLSSASEVGIECVVVPSSCAKEFKVALESNGLLDKKLRISPFPSSIPSVSIPLTLEGSRLVDLALNTEGEALSIPDSLKLAIHKSTMNMRAIQGDESCKLIRCRLNNVPASKIVLLNQRSKLEAALVELLLRRTPSEGAPDLLERITRAVRNSTLFRGSKDIERVGDILVLSNHCFNKEELSEFPWNVLEDSWKLLPNSEANKDVIDPYAELWSCLASSHNCRALCKAARIDKGLKRQSQMRLLHYTPCAVPSKKSGTIYKEEVPDRGVDAQGRALSAGPYSAGWVTVKENGLKYSFDITRVMFCSGNVTERTRMAKPPVICQGVDSLSQAWNPKEEVVVDLYAGIGYYVVPFLVHHKVKHVHACEWNEDSLTALAFNLKTNGVSPDRYTLHAGDNQNCVRPKAKKEEGSEASVEYLNGVADRVNLGLIPSSKQGWPLAVACLKCTGGWMHVHDNVHENQMENWKESLLSELKKLCQEEGGGKEELEIRLHHLETVKSYAPRIFHVVADIFLH